METEEVERRGTKRVITIKIISVNIRSLGINFKERVEKNCI